MKKLFTFLILFSVIFRITAQNFTYNGINYTVISETEKTCMTAAYGNGSVNEINLSEKVYYNNKEYTLTKIGSASFRNNTQISGSLVIPSSVTEIGTSAFEGCNGFNGSLVIPDSVTEIGKSAFEGCSGFDGNLIIGNNVNSIGNSAFSGCSGFNGSLVIPDSITEIGTSAFEGCSGFDGNLIIGNNVNSIGSYAFRGCNSFNELIFLPIVPPNTASDAFLGWNYSEVTLTVPWESLQAYKSAVPWSQFKTIQSSYELDGFIYTINSRNLATIIGVTGSSVNLENLVIPSTVSVNNASYNVTAIGEGAFENCSGLSGTLSIPASITSIGANAFAGCGDITEVICQAQTPPFCAVNIFDASVYENALLKVSNEEAYSEAQGWNNFKNINGYVFTVDELMYRYILDNEQVVCIGLSSTESSQENLNIPASVSYNGNDYPVTSIAASAFANCTSVTGTIYIPSSITSLGKNAFAGCDGITSLNLSDGSDPLEINQNAFNGVSVKDLYMGRNLTGEPLFNDLTSLETLEFGTSISSIAANAFNGYTNLNTVTIPTSVTSIGSNAFKGCNSLTTLNYNAINCTNFGASVFPSSIQNLNIGNQVTQIPTDFLESGNQIQRLVFPNSVTALGNNSFLNSKSLRSLYIGNGLMSINKYAFYESNSNAEYGVNRYVIPKIFWLSNTVPTDCEVMLSLVNYVSNSQYPFAPGNIKQYQYLSTNFEVDGTVYIPLSPSDRTCDAVDCTYDINNTNVRIPTVVANQGINLTVKDISNYAFYDNDFLETLSIANEGNIGDLAFYSNNNATEISITNSGNVGNSSFQNNTSLSDLTIANLGSIGTSAFSDCTSMKTLVIPNSITSIGSGAFQNCSVLAKVELGNGFPVLPYYVFAGCISLPEISVPENVEQIQDYAFLGCTSLTRFILEDSDDMVPTVIGSNGSDPLFNDCPLDFVYIGCNIQYEAEPSLGYSPFYNNKTLREVVITDLETQIYNYEFYLCSGLRSLTIGNGVTNIGYWAFSGCFSLEYYSAGYKVETIDEEAFSDCTGIKEYYSYSSIPPVCESQALDDINKWTCTLYVPKTALDLYSTANQWKEFFKIEGLDIPAEEIVLNTDHAVIEIGSTFQLTATWVPENATVTKVNWESSDTSVVSVDTTGKLTAVGVGQAVITVTSLEYPEAMAICNVEVYEEEVAVYAFLMSQQSIEIPNKTTYMLELVPAFAGALIPGNIEWRSSDESVAIVENGLVTALNLGSTTITAKGLDENGNMIVNSDGSEAVAKCTVFVNADAGVDSIFGEDNQLFDIFTITGQTVKRNARFEQVKSLVPGIYIINGKKVLVK